MPSVTSLYMTSSNGTRRLTDGKAVSEVVDAVTNENHPGHLRDGGGKRTVVVPVTAHSLVDVDFARTVHVIVRLLCQVART